MGIVKNEGDKLPEDLIAGRAKTYETMMNVGYLVMMPISLGFVMLIALLMLGTSIPMSILLGTATGLGVLAFAKVFLVH
ncbi:MAG: hypothetical protein AAGH41_08285 [Pseudomonadota bacterium]